MKYFKIKNILIHRIFLKTFTDYIIDILLHIVKFLFKI
jgi:hypothetical protein